MDIEREIVEVLLQASDHRKETGKLKIGMMNSLALPMRHVSHSNNRLFYVDIIAHQ